MSQAYSYDQDTCRHASLTVITDYLEWRACKDHFKVEGYADDSIFTSNQSTDIHNLAILSEEGTVYLRMEPRERIRVPFKVVENSPTEMLKSSATVSSLAF